MDSDAICRFRKQAIDKVFKVGTGLFVVAVIIKLSLEYFSPDWLIPLSEKLRGYPAYKHVDFFSDGRPVEYVLLSFLYLSFVILFPFSVIVKYRYCAFKETAIYYLRIKNASWKKIFFLSFFVFFVFLFVIYSQVKDPTISTGFTARVFNMMYSDDYLPLFVSFVIILPGVLTALTEIVFMLTSMVMYKISVNFRTSVNQ
ncbi:hypothetical protein QI600_004104 [Salmonella enterica]|nr:hypothetical protein [Salmonella enterica]